MKNKFKYRGEQKMKLAGIIAAIGAFGAKIWQIIKAVSKLRTVKKEVMEAYEQSMATFNYLSESFEKMKQFFSAESDGGKKLTPAEIQKAGVILKESMEMLNKAKKEIFEAKDEIKKLIDAIKKKK